MHEKQRNVLLISHQINGFVLNLLETDGLVAPHFHRNRETLRKKALEFRPKSQQEKKKTRTRRIRTHRSFFFKTTKSAEKPNLSSPILFRFPPHPPSRLIYSPGGSQRTRGFPPCGTHPHVPLKGFLVRQVSSLVGPHGI